MRGPAIVLVIAFATQPVVAQAPDEQAAALFAEGRALIDGDPKGACAKFNAAIELDPTAPGVMLNLGLCNELLERYATSLIWFRKAQSASSEAGLTDYEQAAKDHTTQLATKVAIARIDASAAPADAEIKVDNRIVLPSDYGRLEVDFDSVIEARAPGKVPFRHRVDVQGTDAGTIKIELIDLMLAPLHDPDKGRRRLGYGIAAAGIGLLAASGLYTWKIRRDYNGESDYAVGQRKLTRWGNVMFFSGVAGVIAGGVLVFTARKPDREAQLVIAPMVGPEDVGLAVGGRF